MLFTSKDLEDFTEGFNCLERSVEHAVVELVTRKIPITMQRLRFSTLSKNTGRGTRAKHARRIEFQG